MAATYLIGTWESQSVQQRNENISWNEEAQNVSKSHEPILSPISVDFCWHAYDGHSRLEWGDEGQRNRNTSHAPVCHQELLCSPLAPTRQGVEHAYARRGSQQARKYHIVHSCEVFLVKRVHLEERGRIVFLFGETVRWKENIFAHTPQSWESADLVCSRNATQDKLTKVKHPLCQLYPTCANPKILTLPVWELFLQTTSAEQQNNPPVHGG